jgi:hypothetical protein
MITTQTAVGPDTINVYCEGLTWHDAFFNLEQPFSYKRFCLVFNMFI